MAIVPAGEHRQTDQRAGSRAAATSWKRSASLTKNATTKWRPSAVARCGAPKASIPEGETATGEPRHVPFASKACTMTRLEASSVQHESEPPSATGTRSGVAGATNGGVVGRGRAGYAYGATVRGSSDSASIVNVAPSRWRS